jgi:hypothetical protein
MEVDKVTLMATLDIFIRHSKHRTLGAGLLHRHDTVQDGTMIFHEVPPPEPDICIPQALPSIDMAKITANWRSSTKTDYSRHISDDSGEATQIDADFASDLGKFSSPTVEGSGFQLFTNFADREDFDEFTHPSVRGTVSISFNRVLQLQERT